MFFNIRTKPVDRNIFFSSLPVTGLSSTSLVSMFLHLNFGPIYYVTTLQYVFEINICRKFEVIGETLGFCWKKVTNLLHVKHVQGVTHIS